MSEELIQRDLLHHPATMGEWFYYNVGNTSLADLRAAHIIPDRQYTGLERKKPDALVARNGRVIAAVEYKRPEKLRTERQIAAAIEQEIATARALRAKVYIVTDGQKAIWVNPETGNRVLDEGGVPLAAPFDPKSPECAALMAKIAGSVGPNADRIFSPETVDPLPLATKVWQDLWSVSGATPENCLYSFVEVFIFKYLSDLDLLPQHLSFQHLMEVSRMKNSRDEGLLDFYARSIRPEIKRIFPAGTRDNTTIINGTIFVSKDENAVSGYATVFRKILERFAAFVPLQNIDRDFKSRLFETFLKESISKKNWGQYFTPIKVVRAIVDMVDVAPGMTICDPACGVGKFLLEPIAKDVHRFFPIENGRITPKVTLKGFDKGFDREEQKTIILAKANMLIYLADVLREDPSQTRALADVFNETFFLQTNSILGTLAHPVRDRYDLILTNPPYVMSGSSNLKDEIAKDERLRNYFTISAMGIEGLFMEWIVRALKPGGKAFVVVPDGILNRANDRRLREFILSQCFIDAVISLPINTFFTTNKKTYILALTKKVAIRTPGSAVSALPEQTDPVFTYYCSEIGESRDTYRFDIPQNDLKAATALFNMFKGAKKDFRTEDRRCKVVSIDAFRTGAHWCVEKWWTKEEKVTLGIEEEVRPISAGVFRAMMREFSAVMEELGEPLDEFTSSPSVKMKDVSLSELFVPVKGLSKYTKKFGNEHQGPFPVYSASSQTPLTHIDTFDYDGRFMTWSTNGFAGTILVLDGKFSVNGDRGVLVPRDGRTDLDLDYMRYTLEPIFRDMAKGRKGDRGEDEFTKLYPSMIETVVVPVPVDDNGNISLSGQQEIAARHRTIEQCKREIAGKCRELLDQKVEP